MERGDFEARLEAARMQRAQVLGHDSEGRLQKKLRERPKPWETPEYLEVARRRARVAATEEAIPAKAKAAPAAAGSAPVVPRPVPPAAPQGSKPAPRLELTKDGAKVVVGSAAAGTVARPAATAQTRTATQVPAPARVPSPPPAPRRAKKAGYWRGLAMPGRVTLGFAGGLALGLGLNAAWLIATLTGAPAPTVRDGDPGGQAQPSLAAAEPAAAPATRTAEPAKAPAQAAAPAPADLALAAPIPDAAADQPASGEIASLAAPATENGLWLASLSSLAAPNSDDLAPVLPGPTAEPAVALSPAAADAAQPGLSQAAGTIRLAAMPGFSGPSASDTAPVAPAADIDVPPLWNVALPTPDGEAGLPQLQPLPRDEGTLAARIAPLQAAPEAADNAPPSLSPFVQNSVMSAMSGSDLSAAGAPEIIGGPYQTVSAGPRVAVRIDSAEPVSAASPLGSADVPAPILTANIQPEGSMPAAEPTGLNPLLLLAAVPALSEASELAEPSAAHEALPDPAEEPLPYLTSGWSEPVRSFLPASLSDDEIGEIMVEMERAGIPFGEPRQVDFRVSQTHVRYYHAEDAARAELVALAVDGEARDFTTTDGPEEGRLDLYVAGNSPVTPKKTKRNPRPAVSARVSEEQALRQALVQKLRSSRTGN